MEAQEIFDTVAVHLLTQKKKSEDYSRRCLFRSPDGLKCALGILISDDEYLPTMENVGEWPSEDAGCEDYELTVIAARIGHHSLCQSLQHVHDEEEVDAWLQALIDVAKDFELKTSVLIYLP